MAAAENRRIVVASHPGYIVGRGSDRRLTQREPGGLCRVFLFFPGEPILVADTVHRAGVLVG